MSGMGGVLRTRAFVRVALAVAGVLGIVGALAPAASAATAVTCGSVISAPGSYFLAANCSGPGITITSSNVTLQLNGHTMTGAGSDVGVLIDDSTHPVSGVKVLGPGTITNYRAGVTLGLENGGAGVSGSTVTGLTASGNFNFGILLANSANGNRVQSNTADGNFEGIAVAGSNNSINANTTEGNAGGIRVSGGNNVINANTANNNEIGILVLVDPNRINGNTADGNRVGIRLEFGATSNIINGNTALGNSINDLVDDNPGCDSNKWNGDIFKTRNQTCIH